MPMPHIGEYREKKQNNFNWYFYAFLIGIALFLILLVSTKGTIFISKFVFKIAKDNPFYFGVGILILIFLKIRSRKNKKKLEARRDEYSYR